MKIHEKEEKVHGNIIGIEPCCPLPTEGVLKGLLKNSGDGDTTEIKCEENSSNVSKNTNTITG